MMVKAIVTDNTKPIFQAKLSLLSTTRRKFRTHGWRIFFATS